jgi:ABC-type multidrug transport system ATPase subunit
MTINPAVSSTAGPALLVRTQGADRMLHAGPSYRIGRDPQSDIVIDDRRVSWRHATLRLDGESWLLEDAGSTNGTFVAQQRVQQVAIAGQCQVRLGHPEDGPSLSCSIAVAAAPAGQAGLAVSASPASAGNPPAPAQAPARPAPAPAPGGWPQAQAPVPAAAAQAPAGWPPAPPPAAPPAARPGAGHPPRPESQSRERMPSAVMRLPTRLLRIGRAADNEVVVADLSVSRYHAELRKAPRGGYEIVDLASHNGTFLNGQRIGSAPVTERDIIAVGPATFRLVGEQLQEFIDTGDISLSAQNLTVRLPSGKVLLDHVSFPLGERCLLGVIGPSGAGKSTLLGALTGIRPATEGSVLYDNRDLYTHYAELRHRIGLVPQENILHTQLSARRALGYAAELRFPPDTSKAERRRRIDEVLAELSLTKHADTRTDRLSGGQQKRVNVALELLTKPSLLFLDEPTSGLDPGLDKSVMEMMSELAHDGRTVIVVTHSVANLNLCDRLLVLVPGGKVAFFGPPKDGLRHFGKPGWAEVFQAFDAEPDRDWAGEFRRSPLHAQFVAAEMDTGAPAPRPAQVGTAAPATRNRFAQLSTLCRRYRAVIASDRVFLAFLAAMPIVLGAVIRVLPASQGLKGPNNQGAESLLLILVISACFAGAANAVRELVKERPIYSRERAAGLSAGAYLVSKLVILGLISGLQAVVMVAIGLVGRPLPAHGSFLKHLPLVELLIAMGVLAIVSMTLGLLISAAVDTSEKTMPLLIVAVIFQVVMTGGVFSLAGKAGLEQVAWLAPSRWGFAATASTANLNVITLPAGVQAPPPKGTKPPAKGTKPHAKKKAHAKSSAAGPAGTSPTSRTVRTASIARPATTPSATSSASATTSPTASPSATSSPSPAASSGAGSTGAPPGSGGRPRHHGKAGGHASPKATAPAKPTSQATASTADPLWKHNPRTWLTDMAMMLVLGLAFTLIAWWRLVRLSPGRRR